MNIIMYTHYGGIWHHYLLSAMITIPWFWPEWSSYSFPSFYFSRFRALITTLVADCMLAAIGLSE
ncbi:uncharacterized protein BO88DRAFT_245291 [Aspergillus vadensis CBS 113365]|uniref:Uncharacterized protein n=1 Tax=Aspergillus vadensis (strain CBS 113365 / IMI 142717 / IBT 24658) TaxID=1448311 RepID=A0A319CSB7_ASPVC|nr:hypothetical protein BO88DRAFT_245291 [Aspergillus vadensis CBS 113365]PYH71142.1 hypothetical protein BO88DRAFT_245291 [Aspergillus vadensis CBS 113365]